MVAVAEKIRVVKSGHAAGATVTGLDLSKPYGAAELAALKAALLENLVVALPGQHLSLDDLERITEALGGCGLTPFVDPLPGRPFVVRILKQPHEKLNFGGRWHSDLSYLPIPSAFTLLYCIEAPAVGGDTLFANQYMAFESMPAETRESVRRLTAVHSAGAPLGPGGLFEKVKDQISTPVSPSPEAFREQSQPAVIRHPETGRAALFVNEVYTRRIAGRSEQESQLLLKDLFRRAADERFVWRLRWTKGTLAIWDNRCTQHMALNDYQGYRREMLRTSVKGSVPCIPF